MRRANTILGCTALAILICHTRCVEVDRSAEDATSTSLDETRPERFSAHEFRWPLMPYPNDAPVDVLVKFEFPVSWSLAEDPYRRMASAIAQNGDAVISITARSTADPGRRLDGAFIDALRDEFGVQAHGGLVVPRTAQGIWKAAWEATSPEGRFYVQTVQVVSTESSWVVLCTVDAPELELVARLARSCDSLSVELTPTLLATLPDSAIAPSCLAPRTEVTVSAVESDGCPVPPTLVAKRAVAKERSGGRIEIRLPLEEQRDLPESDRLPWSELLLELVPGNKIRIEPGSYGLYDVKDPRPLALLHTSPLPGAGETSIEIVSRNSEINVTALSKGGIEGYVQVQGLVFPGGRSVMLRGTFAAGFDFAPGP